MAPSPRAQATPLQPQRMPQTKVNDAHIITPGSVACKEVEFPCSACGANKLAKAAVCHSVACVARRSANQQKRDAEAASRAAAADALFVAPRIDTADHAAAVAALNTLTATLMARRGKHWPEHAIEAASPPTAPQPEELVAKRSRTAAAAAATAATAARADGAASVAAAPRAAEAIESQEQVAAAAVGQGKSEYELQREATIAQNQQMLVELGILDAKTTLANAGAVAAMPRKKRPRKPKQPPAGPARRSSRSAPPKARTDIVMAPPPTGHFLWVRFQLESGGGATQWHRAQVTRRTAAKTTVTDSANGSVTKTKPATATVRYESDGSTETIPFPDTSGEVVVEERPPRGALIERQPGGSIRRQLTHIEGWNAKVALRHVPLAPASKPNGGEARRVIRSDRSDLFPMREERWVAVAQCSPTNQQPAGNETEMVRLAITVTWLSPTAMSFRIEKPTPAAAAVPATAAAAAAVLQPLRSNMTINIPAGVGSERDICIIDGKAANACADAHSPHELYATPPSPPTHCFRAT
jgi:hypothetical protein